MSNQTEREAFEQWMVNEAKCIVGSTDPYPAGLERDYWRVWQAALAAHPPEQEQQDALDARRYRNLMAVVEGFKRIDAGIANLNNPDTSDIDPELLEFARAAISKPAGEAK